MTDISTDEHGWLNNVDVNTELSDHERKLYEAYREARKAAGQARAAFEAAMNANAPEGERIVFNYRFGGLSVKRVNGEYKAKPTKPAKPRQSLSDYLNQYPTR